VCGVRTAILLCALAACNLQAQEVLEAEVDHWALAPFLGTGAYQFDQDQTIYVFEYTSRWTWKTASPAGETPRRIGIDVLVPATLGLRSFNLEDLPETLDLDNVATLSVVPGVYATLEMSSRWSLLGIANLGLGARLDGEETALIHRFGLRSRWRFGPAEERFNLIAGIEYTGYNTDRDRSDHIMPVSLTVEYERAIDAWATRSGPTWLVLHVTGSNYLQEFSVDAIEEAASAIRRDLEFGIAVKPNVRFRLWKLSWERIGIAYRRGEGDDDSDFEGIRFIFRSAFDQ
jgi:hypothetical protein